MRSINNKNLQLAAGIMSGTSLDGIDVAIAEIQGVDLDTQLKMIHAKTYPYPKDILKLLQKAVHNEATVQEISHLNFQLGILYAESVQHSCQALGISSEDLTFVASHGQTIYHQGKKEGSFLPSTLQIGSGAVIAQKLKTTCVYDFRMADMAQNGEGAPLVPFVDFILLSDQDKTRVVQNIGGISNVTVLPKGFDLNKVYAFDTGPGNMMMNFVTETYFHQPFDDQGKLARSGKVISSLFDHIMSHPYLKQKPPKSAGREQFGRTYMKALLKNYTSYEPSDILHTVTLATAETMIQAMNQFILNQIVIDELIVSGGGAHHKYLLELIQKQFPSIQVLTSQDVHLSIDYKEALAFIILGNQTLHKKHGTIPTATGAQQSVIVGTIAYYT